jgi:iron complex outermembrane recepter protein
MAFQKSAVSRAALTAIGSSLIAVSAVHAQSSEAQRVEITGSSIKRINGESALPVQIITADDIRKSGFATVTDLMQSLPAMQGFQTSSQSVNGGGAGITTASIHDIGDSYTLVLLNGRRVAPITTGSTVNLNSIPLAAIERVEVLLDGASAVYGSDAIAGVVNFITRKDSTEGLATAMAYVPQKAGGGSYTASISKGFGDLSTDKFNVLLSASFDKQKVLWARQRGFSKSGVLTFRDQGADQEVDLVSSNSVPANITATLSDDSTVRFNAFQLSTGACPGGAITAGLRCFYDYAATVQSIPESDRASLFTSARLNPTGNLSLFGELAYSRFKTRATYAAPAQPGLTLTDALIAADVTPYLGALGHAGTTVTEASMNLRLYDAGGRSDIYRTDALHAVLGAEATVGAFDFTASYTHSQNKWTDQADGGYSSLVGFYDLLNSGLWDPLMAQAGESVDLIAPIVLHQEIDKASSSIDVLSARGSTSVGKLAGGDIGIAFGLDFMNQKYSDDPSAILMGANALQPNYADAIIGGSGGALPFDSSRKSAGVFSELALPITKELEVSASARYDSYGAVKNSKNFDSDGNPIDSDTQGKSSASGTYKLGLRYLPARNILLRGSIGTGFKAPSLADVSKPLTAAGSTGFHDCPPGLSAEKAAYCGPISQEYNISSVGNPATDATALKPEKSTQWTLGMRIEPIPEISVGLDWWGVRLRNQIGAITEDTAFSDGATYEGYFRIVPDPVTGTRTLTFLSTPANLGNAHYQGIDLDGEGRFQTPIGKLTTRAHVTYMIKANYQTPGSSGYVNSMAKIGSDGLVTFRWQANLSMSLESGSFTHTLTGNFKPGYMDDTLDYCRTDANGDCLLTRFGDAQGRYVHSYSLYDWQTRYAFNKDLGLTVGVKNVFNESPPFSVIDQSGTGNARGFDGRYTDPIGRQFYVGASYRF